MNTIPSIGSWVWGEALNPCQVIAIGTQRSTKQTMLKVLCPQGARVIPLESVRGVASTKPNLVVMPRPIQVGDCIRLKVAIETASGTPGTEGTIVEPKTKGLTWAKFESIDRPCMVMPNEFQIVP